MLIVGEQVLCVCVCCVCVYVMSIDEYGYVRYSIVCTHN